MEILFKDTVIHTAVYGSGSPVILLHGFLENHQIWQPFIPELEKKHQVICPDLYGHGKTAGLGKITSMRDFAGLVNAVLEVLKVREAAFIGHSMGGYITMAITELFPEKVERLMLVNSSPAADSAVRRKERDQVTRVVQEHPKVFVKNAVTNLFAQKSRVQFKDKLLWLIKEASAMQVVDIVNSVQGMKVRKDRTDVLRSFSGQKAIIAGEKDTLIPLATLRQISQETQSPLTVFSGGHMSYIEQFEGVQNTISSFLEA